MSEIQIESHNIPGARVNRTVDGQHYIMKLKTSTATFTLRPVLDRKEVYRVQVTPKDLPGLFKNSGISIFAWFEVQRLPGRNAVTRLKDTKPVAGNAVMMWPHVEQEEKTRCFDFVEKIIRNAVPKLPTAMETKIAA